MVKLTSLCLIVALIYQSIATNGTNSGRRYFLPHFLTASTNPENRMKETRSKGFEDFIRRNSQEGKTYPPNVAVAHKCWCTKISVCIYQGSHSNRENFSENFARCLKNRGLPLETERRQQLHVARSSLSATLKRSRKIKPIQAMLSSDGEGVLFSTSTATNKLFIQHFIGYQRMTSNTPWDAGELNKSRFAWRGTEMDSYMNTDSWPMWMIFLLLTTGCFALMLLSCYILHKQNDTYDVKVEFKEPNMRSTDVTQTSLEGDLHIK